MSINNQNDEITKVSKILKINNNGDLSEINSDITNLSSSEVYLLISDKRQISWLWIGNESTELKKFVGNIKFKELTQKLGPQYKKVKLINQKSFNQTIKEENQLEHIIS